MKTFITTVAASLATFLLPVVAFAQQNITQDCSGPIPCAQNTILGQSGDGLSGIQGLIVTIANWMFILLLVLAVMWIIFAAYKYMFSGGAEEAVASAHKMIIYAAVAIAVALLSKGIVFVVYQLVSDGSSAVGQNGLNGNQNGNVNASINVNTKYGSIQLNPNIKF